MQIEGFLPVAAGTVKITTGTVAATVLPAGGADLLIWNSDATNIVFVELGNEKVAATNTTSMPIGPNKERTLRRPLNCTHISTLAAAGSPILYVSAGTSAAAT